MKKIIPILTILFVIVVLAACNKDAPKEQFKTPDTPEELLQNGDWKMTGARYKLGNGDWVDVYGNIPDCERNNILSFVKDVYVVDEGDSKCNAADAQKKEDGNWFFKWNESRIGFSSPLQDTAITVYDTTERILLSLTTTTMKIMTKEPGPNGIRTDEITYSH